MAAPKAVCCCISRDKWAELFPTRSSSLVFVSYMALFINQGILVTLTKNAHSSYDYNVTTVVLLTECVKLVVSLLLYIRMESFSLLAKELSSNVKVLLLYFVPAALYCLYNNLTFTNLATFDPTTYYILLQFRVVVTGVLYQLVFKRSLSRKQWISLLLLTMGCIVKQIRGGAAGLTLDLFHLDVLLVLIQLFCSCFAGVYNEFLLKDAEASVTLQNIFMYLDSIVCNMLALAVQGQVSGAFTSGSLKLLLRPLVLGVVANNAACGLVTSFFLKSLNSILKTFASALELLFIAIICWLLFSTPLDAPTLLSIAIVSYATYLYTQNPVINQSKNGQTTTV